MLGGRGGGSKSSGGDCFLPIDGNDAGKALMTLLGIPANTNYEEVSYRSLHAAMCAENMSNVASTGLAMVGDASRRTQVFVPEYLDSIPALPHTTADKIFVMDLQALQGDMYGGVSALYLCTGVLTSMVVDVTEGVHLKLVRILERASILFEICLFAF
jgi:hypothetical protein